MKPHGERWLENMRLHIQARRCRKIRFNLVNRDIYLRNTINIFIAYPHFKVKLAWEIQLRIFPQIY